MAQSPSSTARPVRGMTIATWIIQVLLAVVFAAAGGAKLGAVRMMVEIFDHIGFGQWFRYVVGAVEIVGAIALLIPRLAIYGTALLACTMIGAVLIHLTVIGGNPVPASALLVLNLAVLYLRRAQVAMEVRHVLGVTARPLA